MVRKYKSNDGSYLAVDETSEGYEIRWVVPDDEYGIGAHAGESYRPGEELTKKASHEDWEVWIVDTVTAEYAEHIKPGYPHVFANRKKANEALKAANEALLSKEKPWPAWARTAKKEGWTPPEGWKPK